MQGATPAQQYAVLAMICQQATHRVEQIVNQPLRAVQTTEELAGPNFRVTVQRSSGNGRIIAVPLARHPGPVGAASPELGVAPPVDPCPAGNFEPEFPVDGLYGASAPSGAGAGRPVDPLRPRVDQLARWAGQGWPREDQLHSGWPHTVPHTLPRPGGCVHDRCR